MTGTKLRVEIGNPLKAYIDGEREYGVYAIEDRDFVMQRFAIAPGRYEWIEIYGEIETGKDEEGRKVVRVKKARGVYAYSGVDNEDDTV